MPQIGGAIMKCEWVQENILLYVYNELPDDARYELEQHLTRCTDCAAELKATRQFHATLSKHPVEEPSPNVLTSSRMRLQEALETAEQGGWWQRFIFEPAAWLRQIQFSPALAAVIFIIGFAGGIGATYKMIKGAQPEIAREVVPTPATESSITGIQSISQEPGSNQINIKYNTVSTQEAQGSLNDQRIQQLLLFAARNNYNSGVRTAAYALFCRSWPQTIRTSTSGCRRATCWPRFRGSIRRVVEKGIPTRCQFVAASVVGRRAAGPGLPRRWKLGAGDHREFSRGKESPRKGGCRHSSRTGRLAIGHQLRYS